MKNTFLIFVLLTFSISEACAGGGWVRKKGAGFAKLGQWWLLTDQHYGPQGEIDPNNTLGLFNTSIYGEYGITKRLTGVLYFPFFSRAYNNDVFSEARQEVIQEGEAINGIGDTDLSLKYGLVQGSKIVVSTMLTLGLPLGKTGGGELGILQTGDGEFNQMIQVDASTSFKISKKVKGYATLYAGINNRTNNFSDEYRFGSELGGIINEKWLLIGRLYGVQSFMNVEDNTDAATSSVFGNNAEHLSYNLEVGYKLKKKFGITASYLSALSGRLIAANSAYSVGVFYEW